MKRLPCLLVLLLTFVACNGSPTAPIIAQWASLSGRVTDKYGNAWGGVSIGVVDAEKGVVASALTNDDGRYSIKELSAGQYRIWLQLGKTGPGYFVSDVDLREGSNTLDIVSR